MRQPREAVGVPDLLEIPAGKLDVEGEEPLEAAKRELAEEIGKAAEEWEHLHTFFTSPGFTDEVCHVYLATGLSDAWPRRTSTSASTSRSGRSPSSTRSSTRCATRRR